MFNNIGSILEYTVVLTYHLSRRVVIKHWLPLHQGHVHVGGIGNGLISHRAEGSRNQG